MKNWWNWAILIWDRFSRMTRTQQLILIGSIILPAGSLILIFSQLGRLITQKLTKGKTSMTFGKLITKEELYEELYERKNAYRNEEQNRCSESNNERANKRDRPPEDFIFWN